MFDYIEICITIKWYSSLRKDYKFSADAWHHDTYKHVFICVSVCAAVFKKKVFN